MNRYFDNNRDFDSNSRIFNAYYNAVPQTEQQRTPLLTSLRAKLSAALRSNAARRVLRVVKPIVFSAALLGILGIAAAIEAGSLGLGSGIAVSAILLGIEYLCLRPHRA
ncbi:MAG: hypothetical protein IJW49_08635 [Clostridia bacterium]|nr:hypothetical protein [Clostridia bacterium]